MKRISESNIFWLILSLLASFAIWIYVASEENDDINVHFRGVGINMTGEENLKNKNLVVLDLDTNTVDIEVKGPRKEIGILDEDDLQAVIDVSKYTRAGSATPTYTVVFPNSVDSSDITVVKKSPETVNFTISEMVTKSIPVRGSFDGSVSEGYAAGTPEFNPSTIEISGPDVYLKDISYAWVSFAAENITSSYTEEAVYKLMSEDGTECRFNGISSDYSTIESSMPVYMVKTLPLKIAPIYGSGATEDNTVITISPESVTFVGNASVLDSLSYITLSTIDLTDFQTTYTDVFPLVYDTSLRNQSGVNEAMVSIEIKGLQTKAYTVENLNVTNVTEGFTAEILSEMLENVIIRGTEEVLSEVNPENIRAVADLSDFNESAGTYLVPVKIYIDGFNDVGPIGEYQISVDLKKIN